MKRVILLMGMLWLAHPAAAQAAEPDVEIGSPVVDAPPAPAAVAEWEDQFHAAMSTRAAELAATGTAEGLLAAALIELPPGNGEARLDGEYVDWLVEEGELGACRHLLREHGIPVEPPPGWLPDDPDHRALLSDDA